MNYSSKFLEYEKSVQRLSKIVSEHSIALRSFERLHRDWNIPYNNLSAIQNACKSLLETHGISKTILGLQSIAEQIEETQKFARGIGNISPTIASLDMGSNIARQMEDAQKFARGIGDISPTIASLDMGSNIARQMEDVQKFTRGIGDISPIAYMFRDHLANQVANQIPFLARLQPRVLQMERIFTETTGIAAIKYSEPFISSALSVARVSLNFSVGLDTLPYSEQLRIVDALDNVNLDTDADIIIPEDLSDEIHTDYVTLVEFLRTFWKENNNQLLGILTTVETTVKNFSENDFSNPFTIIAFIYNCIILILNQLNLPSRDEKKTNDD